MHTAVRLALGLIRAGWMYVHSTQPLCGDMASASDEVMSACCQLITQYTARCRSAESSVDDFDTCRGDVFIRAVTILRYIESQPPTGRFVLCIIIAFDNLFTNFFSVCFIGVLEIFSL